MSTPVDWIKDSVRNSRNVTEYEDRYLKEIGNYNNQDEHTSWNRKAYNQLCHLTGISQNY